MKIGRPAESEAASVMPLTAMTDIVFLLLVFFVMTFRIVAPEGDLNVTAATPVAFGRPPSDVLFPPIKVRLRAGPDGELTGIELNERRLADLDSLQSILIGIVGDQHGPDALTNEIQLKLEADEHLRYEYLIAAVTAASGYVTDDHQIVQLIKRIGLAAPPAL